MTLKQAINFKRIDMSSEEQNPKHSTGKGAQAAHHNTGENDSYVENPKEAKPNETEDSDYLEKKWKQISKDFEKTYNLDISKSDYKDESFSETLKNLESKTGKSRTTLEDEIRNWKSKD
ncbi:MAG: hypothetical protein CL526_09730 [Aequorivita sp.]|nr:hypothetical protein [Aequorivita sp.]